jgi:hypothetical protein
MPVKITDLTTSTTITGNDYIQIIDSDDVTTMGSPTGTNKKITASNAANQLANLITSVPTIMIGALSTKANLASPTFSGIVSLPNTTTIGAVNGDEIGHLSGVTNNIQGQLNLKAPINNPTFTGTVSGISATMVGLGNVTNESKATMFASPTFTGTVTLPSTTSIGSVSSAEIGHLDGVTGPIQTQLNNRVSSISGTSPIVVTGTTTPTISLGVVPTDKGGAGTTNGILKANGSGTVSSAVDGTDYFSPNTLKNSPAAAKAWVNFNGTSAGAVAKVPVAATSGTVTRVAGTAVAIITRVNHGLPNGYTINVTGITGITGGAYAITLNGPDAFSITTTGQTTALNSVAITYTARTVTKSGTAGSNTVATIRSVNHGLPTGHVVHVTGITGIAAGAYVISGVQPNTFDITVTANTTVLNSAAIVYTAHTVSRPAGSAIATIRSVNHGLADGESIYVPASTGIVSSYYTITRIDANSFTVTTAANTVLTNAALTYDAYLTSSMVRSSYNVSLIRKDAVGRYFVKFTTPMTDSNYCAIVSGTLSATDGSSARSSAPYGFTNEGFKLQTDTDTDVTGEDWAVICATVFGN